MDSLAFVFEKNMKQKYMLVFKLFDINFRVVCDDVYPFFQELKDFETEEDDVQYTYYISSCEKISEDEKIHYRTEDFNISCDDEITKKKFIRYDTKISNQKYGVQLIYQKCKNILNITLAEKYLQRYKNTILIMQYMGIEKLLSQNQGFLLHASLIAYKNQGIVFSAPSGVGKSTQAELWHQHRCAEIINGDRVGIRKLAQDETWAYGSPMSGSSWIIKNKKIILKAIVVLRQSEENHIRKMRPGEAFSALYSETLLNLWDEQYMKDVTDILTETVQKIPVFLLSCRPDESAVKLLEEELNLQEEEQYGGY